MDREKGSLNVCVEIIGSHAQSVTTGSCNYENDTCHNYSILKKLSWEVATLTWKLMGISYSERKTFPATFLPWEV